MPNLTPQADLTALQRYVEALETERGFAQQNARDKCLLLGEEVGELFKAVRQAEGMPMDVNAVNSEIADELADVLIYLYSIANRYAVNLEDAFRAKEAKNKTRRWA
ncbi:pyrophosphohydrolase [Saccharospirillum sp. MSK14-1]|uniref:MazG nucleotide pyrophosphohydrolase domain-containing protein n=1 Tax=Saccharospirillum sp. MSK14-1 TaxID=1897632 RepID=UPI000D386A1C|nr:MazG nucleotide pyrophosphohydrolase domain-containing protein [Saccharospirillum sp. MSK14-1]PTY37623.1 pyrophosphohydrolase [Saccharospirillum sp. MSK14-1]